jgi:hypothetical protein
MSTINLYTKKDRVTNRLPASAKPPISGGSAVIPEIDLYEYDLNGMPVYGFAYQINNPKANFALTPMTIPGYFREAPKVNGEGVDTHGLFLINLGEDLEQVIKFLQDKLIFGAYGCPKRILTSASNDAGEDIQVFCNFNKMRFYPFILPDFSVGYYVCDGQNRPDGSEPKGAWRPYDPKEHGVALDAPVTYDPTLGLYITRASHIEPV